MKKLFVVAAILLLASCTQNSRVRNFGGTGAMTIPENNIFVNATWKGNDLWIVTKDTLTGTFYLREKSRLGFAEGTFIFKSSK